MSFRDIWQAQKHGLQSLASVGVIGMHMVSGPIVGVAIGWGLDKWLGTSPWFKLVFLLIGIGENARGHLERKPRRKRQAGRSSAWERQG